ncbi:TetR/AcrR family transcriptional regulator [Micromonospora sp. NPDC047812]|uniref:TetR/AcrR family transcriptional regulator n=1 Tax=Micromonospora sp. NPDC047812 TaxID=3155742 RepID=UPI0034568F4B
MTQTPNQAPAHDSASGTARPTKGERTRQRILQTALEIFAEYGYAGVSLREVAARAGITHAGLLHYFAGKDDLLLTMMIERDRAEVDAIRHFVADTAAAEGGPQSVDEVIIRWLIRDIARNQRRPDIAPLFVKLSAEATDSRHPAHDYFRNRYATLRASLARGFAHAFATADPPITGRDPDICAQQLIALADGLQVQWLLDRNSTDMVASLLDYLRCLGIEPSGWADIDVPDDQR